MTKQSDKMSSRIWIDRGHGQRRNRAMQVIAKRQGKSATYTEPLVVATADASSVEQQNDNTEAFLAEFYKSTIFEQNQHFHDLIKSHPDTIGTHYELLVPHKVSYDQFWSRYMYRCSLQTVLSELLVQEEYQAKVTSTIMPILQTKLQEKYHHKTNKLAASFLPRLHSKLIQEEIEKAMSGSGRLLRGSNSDSDSISPTTTSTTNTSSTNDDKDDEDTTTLEDKTANNQRGAALFIKESDEQDYITEQQQDIITETEEESESSSSESGSNSSTTNGDNEDDAHEEDDSIIGSTITTTANIVARLEAEVLKGMQYEL